MEKVMSNQTPPKSIIEVDKAASSAEEMTKRLLEQFQNLGDIVNTDSTAYTEIQQRLPKHLQTDSKNPSVKADVLSIANFEEEFARIEQEDIKKKNRCSVSEYVNQWLLLHCHFEHSGFTEIGEFRAERAKVSAMYFDRFSSQHAITIFADHNPNEVIAVLPRQYNSAQLIRGNLVNAIDQFISYADHDRPDVNIAANHALLSATAQANSIEVNQHQLMQAHTADAIIKVLTYFNPAHPLIKKMAGNQLVSTEEKTEQVVEEKKKDDNIVDDLNLEDFGI